MVWGDYQFNEKPADIAREKAATKAVARAWELENLKLNPYLYTIDWAFFRSGHLVCWGEFKSRKRRYDPYIVGVSKWHAGRTLAHYTGAPFYLFVQWPEGLFWYRTNDDPLPIRRFNGKRGQPGDVEPCVLIPLTQFHPITDQDN